MKTRKQYSALLNRAHGYASLASRMLPHLRTPVTAQRSWTLAEAIANRYAATERRWPVMALLFEKPAQAGVTVSNTFNTSHPGIFINPRVILRMLVSHKEGINKVITERMPAQPFVKGAANMTLAASTKQQLVQQHEDVVTRIVLRTVREETPVIENHRQPSRNRARVAQNVPVENDTVIRSPILTRVFRHAAKANNESTVVAMSASNEKEKPRTVAGRELNTAVAMPAQVDITRITDQVMQALDKRIVAQRERMGRI